MVSLPVNPRPHRTRPPPQKFFGLPDEFIISFDCVYCNGLESTMKGRLYLTDKHFLFAASGSDFLMGLPLPQVPAPARATILINVLGKGQGRICI